MGTVTTSLLEGRGGRIDADIHAVLFGRGRSHLKKEEDQLSGEQEWEVVFNLDEGSLTGKTAGPYWKVLGRPGMPV